MDDREFWKTEDYVNADTGEIQRLSRKVKRKLPKQKPIPYGRVNRKLPKVKTIALGVFMRICEQTEFNTPLVPLSLSELSKVCDYTNNHRFNVVLKELENAGLLIIIPFTIRNKRICINPKYYFCGTRSEQQNAINEYENYKKEFRIK